MDYAITVLKLDTAGLVEANLPLTRQYVAATLEQSEGRLLIDVSGLRYFDTRGLTEILRWVAQAEQSGEVRLFGESPEVHALFELLRVPSSVRCYWSREEAVLSFSQASSDTPIHSESRVGETASGGLFTGWLSNLRILFRSGRVSE